MPTPDNPSLFDVDWSSIPAPVDDGRAAHLEGSRVPELALPATDGTRVSLASLSGRVVVFTYPRTGRPGEPALVDDWDQIPGARGCTPQSCAFRDLHDALRGAGATHVFGLSTQDLDYQREAVERLHLPFPLLSDADLEWTRALALPTLEVVGNVLIARMAWIVDNGIITKVFYPVFPPDRNAADVLAWLRRDRVRAAYERFLSVSLDGFFDAHRAADPESHALALFAETARTVPAYRAFLAEHGVEPSQIRTRDDFERLPLTTKDGYLNKYPLAARCRGGELSTLDTIAVSSGSTGESTLWPRSIADELAIARRFEQVFVDSFGADRNRTLAIVCFPLGTWVGGMFTAACCRHLAAKGYPIFTVTPGNVRPGILRVVRELAPQFQQTVLLGYPPFIKDVIDEGLRQGIPWRDHGMKRVLAGEVFTEAWRTLVCERAGISRPLLDSASLYGTADGGVLGTETPVSIAIRRFLADRPEDARALFGEARLPTLAQFDPCSRYFEEHEGTLVFSGDNGVPLVRYHISDRGGIVPFAEMIARIRALGCDPIRVAREAGAKAIRELPFVYVFGRSHFAISYFGANIFPEMVSGALELPEIARHVTGKFVMRVVADDDQNHQPAIAIELAPGATGTTELADALAGSIVAELLRLDPEFAAYVPPDRQRPHVTLHPAGDPEYFPVGVKHRYSRS